MRLGIFARTFARSDLNGCLRAVTDAGIGCVQFNLSVVGLPTIPTEPVGPETIREIRSATARHGVELAAISGTFNAAHPDHRVRAGYIERFPALCAVAGALGIGVITLCSGSRDADDMWRWHPDNPTPQAWADSREALTALAGIAEDAGIRTAVEPEHSNVVDTADRALAMIAEIGSPALGVVYDAANLLDPDRAEAADTERAIVSAVAALGPHILLAHAKELTAGRAAVPAGAGLLPWGVIVHSLREAGFDGALVTHGLDEADVPRAVRTLRAVLDSDG